MDLYLILRNPPLPRSGGRHPTRSIFPGCFHSMLRSVLQRVPASLPYQPSLAVPRLPSTAQQLRRESLSFVTCPALFTPRVARKYSGTSCVMAAAGDAFSGREWKDGEAHEVLPKVFLGSMVSSFFRVMLLGVLSWIKQTTSSLHNLFSSESSYLFFILQVTR